MLAMTPVKGFRFQGRLKGLTHARLSIQHI